MGVCLSCKNFDNLDIFSYDGHEFSAKVVKVYDGDTITVVFYDNGYKKFNMRMNGYDSPEMKPLKNIENRDLHIHAATSARDYLARLILGKVVKIRLQKFEKYGRLLGEVIYHVNVNDLMVDVIKCKKYDGKKKTDYSVNELKTIISECSKRLV